MQSGKMPIYRSNKTLHLLQQEKKLSLMQPLNFQEPKKLLFTPHFTKGFTSAQNKRKTLPLKNEEFLKVKPQLFFSSTFSSTPPPPSNMQRNELKDLRACFSFFPHVPWGFVHVSICSIMHEKPPKCTKNEGFSPRGMRISPLLTKTGVCSLLPLLCRK